MQEICPLDTADHLTMGSINPVGYRLVLDALARPGPARANRIDRAACTQLLMPGVDRLTLPANFASFTAVVVQQLALCPHVTQEPTLKPHAAN